MLTLKSFCASRMSSSVVCDEQPESCVRLDMEAVSASWPRCRRRPSSGVRS